TGGLDQRPRLGHAVAMLGVHGTRSRGFERRGARPKSNVGNHDMSRHASPQRLESAGLGTTSQTVFGSRCLGCMQVASLRPAERANSSPAINHLLDRQQHAKSRDASERRLERAFEVHEAPGGAYADEAPRLEAAAQWVSREREPLHAGDAQRGNEAMK